MNENEIENKVEEILKKEQSSSMPTFHEKAADVVSEFGGSWKFIFIFLLFFGGWIALNLFYFSFDSYPFILLNLILSCLSVFQAPFILMSQNRQADIDRQRDNNDYKVDLYTEIRINELNEKMDKLISLVDMGYKNK